MRVVLVGNYEPDAQQSMLRFGAMLMAGLKTRGHDVRLVRPDAVFGRGVSTGFGKWLGYVDKYLLFPRQLRRLTHGADLVHVVDHSNAVYVPSRRTVPWVVTCHDLLAVRGALGEDTDCPASALGRRLQRAIVAGLVRADAIGCDSTSTFADLNRLVPKSSGQIRRTILLGVNGSYRRLDPTEAHTRLAVIAGVPWDEPFLLHVGSNLARKNKAGVLRIFAQLRERWPGHLVFVGASWPEELREQARGWGIESRIFAVPKISDESLAAVYARAHALIYPSKCEGFGWPIIEAQACDCPVICSDRTSLPEVAGEGGLIFRLNDEAGMANAVLRLTQPEFRSAEVHRGHENVRRFTIDRMVDDYLELYAVVRAKGGGP